MMKLAVVLVALFVSACGGVPPIAEMNYAQVMKRADADKVLDVSPQSVETLRAVTLKIRAVAAPKFPQSQSWSWEYHVLNYPGLAAWSFPGAKVLVFEDMTSKLSEDELAMAVGHEVSHHLLRHLETLNAAKRSLVSSVQTRTTQQVMEMEADKLGMSLAIAAGYKREAMASLLKKMADASPTCHEANCTHPNWERRIEQANLTSTVRGGSQ